MTPYYGVDLDSRRLARFVSASPLKAWVKAGRDRHIISGTVARDMATRGRYNWDPVGPGMLPRPTNWRAKDGKLWIG